MLILWFFNLNFFLLNISGKSADKCQERAARTFPSRNVAKFPAKNAKKCQNKSAAMSPVKSANKCQGKSARTCLSKSAVKSPNKSANPFTFVKFANSHLIMADKLLKVATRVLSSIPPYFHEIFRKFWKPNYSKSAIHKTPDIPIALPTTNSTTMISVLFMLLLLPGSMYWYSYALLFLFLLQKKIAKQ